MSLSSGNNHSAALSAFDDSDQVVSLLSPLPTATTLASLPTLAPSVLYHPTHRCLFGLSQNVRSSPDFPLADDADIDSTETLWFYRFAAPGVESTLPPLANVRVAYRDCAAMVCLLPISGDLLWKSVGGDGLYLNLLWRLNPHTLKSEVWRAGNAEEGDLLDIVPLASGLLMAAYANYEQTLFVLNARGETLHKLAAPMGGLWSCSYLHALSEQSVAHLFFNYRRGEAMGRVVHRNLTPSEFRPKRAKPEVESVSHGLVPLRNAHPIVGRLPSGETIMATISYDNEQPQVFLFILHETSNNYIRICEWTPTFPGVDVSTLDDRTAPFFLPPVDDHNLSRTSGKVDCAARIALVVGAQLISADLPASLAWSPTLHVTMVIHP